MGAALDPLRRGQGRDPGLPRGDHGLHFALQLCVLRLYGRFLTTYDTVPLRIVHHLGRHLGLPPVLLLDPMPGRRPLGSSHGKSPIYRELKS
jgi:hypothetical protein